MSYLIDHDDVELIRECSGKALDCMSLYNIIPSPMNYQVWFTYSSGTDLGLSKTIESMIAKKQSFAGKTCNTLYERFFTGEIEHSAITIAGNSVQKELAKIASSLKTAGDGTSSFSNSLNDHLDNLAEIEGGGELKTILGALLSDTRKIEEETKTLESELRNSSQEIQSLQDNLESVRKENRTDQLTNIGNRKCFEETLKTSMENAAHNKTDLCLIMGDVDFFKSFNDNWGHHVGDQVLKVVAHIMKTDVKDKGTATRFGGEEFAMIMPATTMDEAVQMANLVRQDISKRTIKRKSTGELIGKITISFGVACYRAGDKRDDFLERADAALYHAKQSGRNCVKTQTDLQSPLPEKQEKPSQVA